MFCANCGHPLEPGSEFCAECGTPVAAAEGVPAEPSAPTPPGPAAGVRFCGECGTREDDPQTPFCRQCGTPFAGGPVVSRPVPWAPAGPAGLSPGTKGLLVVGGGVLVGVLIVVLGLVALNTLGDDDDQERPAEDQTQSQGTPEATEEGETPTPTVTPTETTETPTPTPTPPEATETPLPAEPYASADFLVPFTLDLPEGWVVRLDTEVWAEFLHGEPPATAAFHLTNYAGAPGLVGLPPEDIVQKVLSHAGPYVQVLQGIQPGTLHGRLAAGLELLFLQDVLFTEGVLKDQFFRTGDQVTFLAVSVEGRAVLIYEEALQEDWAQYEPFFEAMIDSLRFL